MSISEILINRIKENQQKSGNHVVWEANEVAQNMTFEQIQEFAAEKNNPRLSRQIFHYNNLLVVDENSEEFKNEFGYRTEAEAKQKKAKEISTKLTALKRFVSDILSAMAQ